MSATPIGDQPNGMIPELSFVSPELKCLADGKLIVKKPFIADIGPYCQVVDLCALITDLVR